MDALQTAMIPYTPDELILALCCGGSGCSQVSDSGFWMVTQYFGLNVTQAMKSWTAMKMIASVVGLLLILSAHALLR